MHFKISEQNNYYFLTFFLPFSSLSTVCEHIFAPLFSFLGTLHYVLFFVSYLNGVRLKSTIKWSSKGISLVYYQKAIPDMFVLIPQSWIWYNWVIRNYNILISLFVGFFSEALSSLPWPLYLVFLGLFEQCVFSWKWGLENGHSLICSFLASLSTRHSQVKALAFWVFLWKCLCLLISLNNSISLFEPS